MQSKPKNLHKVSARNRNDRGVAKINPKTEEIVEPKSDVDQGLEAKDFSAIDELIEKILKNPDNQKIVGIDLIDPSPENRKIFSLLSIQQLAEDIKQNGIIQDLILRFMPGGRYEIVVGERRFRAAKLNGFTELPVKIYKLTDQEARLIRYAENGQREDPHPLEEARLIADLQKDFPNIQNLSRRLGKSTGYIFTSLKLLSLIDPIKEIFLAGKLSKGDCYLLAALPAESQQDFFTDYCKKWGSPDFRLVDIRGILEKYTYDLKKAPFDLTNEKLIDGIGSCITCPFNSATTSYLFPEQAKVSVCQNKGCYRKKYSAQLTNDLNAALAKHNPSAVFYRYLEPKEIKNIETLVPALIALKKQEIYQVSTVEIPKAPRKENYERKQSKGKAVFNKKEYDSAVEEFNEDKGEFELNVNNGKYLKALYIRSNGLEIIYYTLEKHQQPKSKSAPSEKVKDAISTGTAKRSMIEEEITRIVAREKRAKEIDREKVQKTVHEKFELKIKNEKQVFKLTKEDIAASRLLVYQALDYDSREQVSKRLFPNNTKRDISPEIMYKRLCQLKDNDYAFMIRKAMVCKSESQWPTNSYGVFLYKQAGPAGIELSSIEKDQKLKADSRLVNHEKKLKNLRELLKKAKK